VTGVTRQVPALDRNSPPRPGKTPPFRFPDFEVVSCDELEVYLLPRATLPLAHIDLVIAAGADGEPEGSRGLATLAADLLDEGTVRRSSQEIAALAEALGTEVEASSDWDGTYLDMTLRSAHVKAGLGLLFELWAEVSFPDREVARLKRRRLAELRRSSSRPDFLAARELLRSLYGSHVYGESLLGVASSVESLDRDTIVEWYSQRLRSAPTALVVTGTFDTAEVLSAVGVFAAAVKPAVALRPPPPLARRAGRRIRIVDRPHARQTELRVVAQVLNCVLGGKFTSRLNLSLRERLGVTYGAWSRFSPRRGAGPFVAGAAVETESTGVAAREILEEMGRLRREPVSAEELRDAKSYLVGTFPYSLQTLEGLAGRLEELTLHPGLPRDIFRTWPSEVAAVGAEEVLRVASELLHPQDATVVAVGPAAAIVRQLESLGSVEVVPPEAS
jgi:zinc protease